MASSPKNSSENPPPRELEQRLTILEGIGASSAQKLSEIGIVRIADLAQLNPSSLGDQLRSANYDVKLATLEKWIEQARQFMASVDTEPSSESSAVASEPPVRSPVVEAEAQPTPAANEEKPDRWEEVGNFHITAQAYADGADLHHRWVIRHLETNGVEILPDIVGDRLHDWMTPRLSEITRDRDSTAKTMAPPLMQFTGLKVRQPSNPNSPVSVDLPHHTMPPEIDAHTAFILEIDFSLTDSGQRNLLQQNEAMLSCQIQAFAKPLSPIRGATIWHDTVVVGLNPQHRHYTTQMHPTQLQSGLYVLQLLAIIPSIKASPLLLEIPIFQVN